MRVALVHDYLNQYGGAERVLEVLCDLFPDAPIYTLLYDEQATHRKFSNRKIITSFLQHFPGALRHHRWYFPLMPKAIERWDFSEFDVVISQSASFTKGIKVPRRVKHLCYLLTPSRFLWDEAEMRVREELNFFMRPLGRLLINRLKIWDYAAAQRPDLIIPISNHIKSRAERIYKREIGEVIHPPVDVSRLFATHSHPDEGKPYFLIVSRLIPYKRIDTAIQACESLSAPLKIIGTGRDAERLSRLAGPNTELLGELNQDLTDAYFQHAEAFLMPQIEDFGIAAVEAMAAGTPVVAYRAGGALDTVVEGKTGLFFDEQSPESLANVLRGFEKRRFNKQELREQAKKFDTAVFRKRFMAALRGVCPVTLLR